MNYKDHHIYISTSNTIAYSYILYTVSLSSLSSVISRFEVKGLVRGRTRSPRSFPG